jgi:hypothetical protein
MNCNNTFYIALDILIAGCAKWVHIFFLTEYILSIKALFGNIDMYRVVGALKIFFVFSSLFLSVVLINYNKLQNIRAP